MTHAEKKVRDLEIVELRKQGYSMNQLAERYGLTVSGIHCICKRYGVAGVMSDRKPSVYHGFTNGNQNTKHSEEEKRAYVVLAIGVASLMVWRKLYDTDL